MNTEDRNEVNKLIGKAFRKLKQGWEYRVGITKSIAMLADELDPPVKEAVKTNPCRGCGKQPVFFNDDPTDCLLCDNPECKNEDDYPTADKWNAANPLPAPVPPERRYKPGQKFNKYGSTYTLFWNGRLGHPQLVCEDFTDTWTNFKMQDLNCPSTGWTLSELGIEFCEPIE